MSLSENKQRMARGELYHAFTPELIRERERCAHACNHQKNAGQVSRRQAVALWRDVNQDPRPMPPELPDHDEDAALFDKEPWVEPLIHADYGYNIKLGNNVYVNFNCTFVDTCLIIIGARTLIGPNCSFFSGTHPLDPHLRDGTKGPESGAEIHIGEDCWLGGSVIVLPGVTIGEGCTIGAGSVVTKGIPAYHVAAGNPARIIRKLEAKATEPS